MIEAAHQGRSSRLASGCDPILVRISDGAGGDRSRKLLTVLRIDAGQQRTSQSARMLRLGNHLRLTSREVERFTRITGIEPVGVKSRDDLEDYIRQCKDYYQGASEEARFLRWLLDEERSRCLCAA